MNWFERFILKRLFNYVAGKLDGYKTYLGGAAVILGGFGFIAHGLSAGNYDEAVAGFIAVGKGLQDIGIGHKLEKQGLTTEEKRRLLQ